MNQVRPNPFHYGRPIFDPAGFFGREKERRQLGSHLSQLHWVSIVGPRRIGKTSLLLHLCHPEVPARLGLRAPEYTFVFVDCAGLGKLDADGWRSLLLEKVAEALEAAAPEVRDWSDFRESLRRLLGDKRKLVLILDEFEALAASPKLDADFFNGLRSLSGGYPVSLVTASGLPLIRLTYQDASVLASPFFNVFVTRNLGLFDDQTARALLSRPEAAFTSETVEFLLGLAGPHPCFAQIAGYHAFEHLQEGPLDEAALHEVGRVVEEETEPHLIHAWKHLSPQAQYTLATLPLAGAGAAGMDELRGACLLRDGGYLSPLVERFAERQVVPDVRRVKRLWVDRRRRQALWGRQRLPLTDLAFRVLCYFLAHPDQPIPWQQLELAVWGEVEQLPSDYEGNPERVDARTDEIRKALRAAGAGEPISRRGGVYTFAAGMLEAIL